MGDLGQFERTRRSWVRSWVESRVDVLVHLNKKLNDAMTIVAEVKPPKLIDKRRKASRSRKYFLGKHQLAYSR